MGSSSGSRSSCTRTRSRSSSTSTVRPRNEGAQQRAAAVFRAIDAFDPVARGCPLDPNLGIPYLHFDGEAQEFFDEWRVALEERLRSEALSP